MRFLGSAKTFHIILGHTLVQVSYVIANDETREREFGALRNIPDSYPKYVISATPLIRASDYDGVTHLSLRKFLVSGFESK